MAWQNILIHPASTFVAGVVVTLGVLALVLKNAQPPNTSRQFVAAYQQHMAKAGHGKVAEGADEEAALERFKGFLQGIGDARFIRENTLEVYAADAYLDDTLVTHHGAAAIEEYFLKTAANLKDCKVTIDDVAKSGPDYYVRWTMLFSATAMRGGDPVESIGISQVRFNREGKVTFHQDFWDAGRNFFGHLPVAGGVIDIIRKRLE